MKKKFQLDEDSLSSFKKLWLVMRLSFLLLLISLLQVSAGVFSQNTRFDLHMKNALVTEVFDQIEKETGFYFFYNKSMINEDARVDIDISNQTIEEILDKLFVNMSVSYEFLGRNIIIKSKGKEPAPVKKEKTVSGKVVEKSGEPIPGVTVLVKGSTVGTITDIDGKYELSDIDEDAVLVFSFIGLKSKEASINGKSVIDVVMEEEAIGLEEVVAIGYGTMKKSDLTGAVASVSSDELEAFPTQDLQRALQGRAAGVHVTTTSSAPGADVKIRVRGNTSINASNDPLYVVDGFAGASLPAAEDIASIEVLKDASATAIYGSRGANGVILVTTKRGESDEVRFELSGARSILKIGNTYDVLNAAQYADYQNALRDAVDSPLPRYEDPESLGVGTDWQDIIFQTGSIQNYQVSASGMKNGVNFYTSARYYGHEGNIINSKYEKFSGRTNLELKVSDKFKAGTRMEYSRDITKGIESQRGSGAGVLSSAFLFNPILGIYNEDGSFTRTSIDFPLDNPYALATQREDDKVRNDFLGNMFLDYKILKSLTLKSTWGVNISTFRRGIFYPRTLISGDAAKGSASIYIKQNVNLITENYLTYDKTFNDIHKLNAMAGYSYQKSNNEYFNAGSSEFVSDALLFWNLSGGANFSIPYSNLSERTMASFYGRLNYNLKDRYLFTLTSRYDGASQFGPNNKWGFFPSCAFAWNVKQEPFMQHLEKLSHLKLRVSYGEIGNAEIPAYSPLAKFDVIPGSVGGTVVNAVIPIAVANSNLTWETTAQFDAGLDIGLFDGKINLVADYYDMKTTDLLYEVPLPDFTGYSSSIQNSGAIQNRGWELTLNTVNFDREFKWNTNFNISFNKNKVIELYGGDVIESASPGHIRGGATHIIREGLPLGTFFGYVFEGVYQEDDDFSAEPGKEPGDEKFEDNNGRDENSVLTGEPDGTVDADDRDVIGDPNPDFIFGLTNDLSYKNFDLNIFIQGSVGNDMMNYTRMELETMNGADNVSTAYLDAWTPENTDTDVPKVGNYEETISSRWVEDASYVRVKNIALGYKLPKHVISNWGIDKLRIYFSVQNLLTFTKYSGLDPEVSWSDRTTETGSFNTRGRNVMPGGDYDSYPSVKTFTFGINIGF